jgi:hypothetical protein
MERRTPATRAAVHAAPSDGMHRSSATPNLPSDQTTITARLRDAVTFPVPLPIDQPWTHQPSPKAVEKPSQRFLLILVLLLFVARQPILTKEEKFFGYELLFRDGVEDYFRASDPDAASRNTLDSSILLGLDVLCGGQRAFITASGKFC